MTVNEILVTLMQERAGTMPRKSIDEWRAVFAELIRNERGECQRIAAQYGGKDAEEIAELIGKRNFET